MKRLKPILAVLICAAMLITGVSANERIEVRIGGGTLDGRLIDSTTYVPFAEGNRALSGGDASVTGGGNSMSAAAGNMTVRASAGDCYIEAAGRYIGGKDVLSIDGQLYVPVRSLAKAYNTVVAWDDATRSVELTPFGGTILPGEAFYDRDEVYWLSRIIEAEAGGEPMAGKILVGNVILNRVASRDFPNTIYGVIFDRKWGVQFTPAATGTIYNTPSADSVVAAKLVLDDYTLSRLALYFLNPDLAENFWVPANRTFLVSVGGHDFYA